MASSRLAIILSLLIGHSLSITFTTMPLSDAMWITFSPVVKIIIKSPANGNQAMMRPNLEIKKVAFASGFRDCAWEVRV